MSVTKAAMAARLVETLDLDRGDAEGLVDSFFDAIRETLVQGQTVKLSGFGHFELRDKRERPGLNPKTLEPIAVTARHVVTFKPGSLLKQQVASNSVPSNP